MCAQQQSDIPLIRIAYGSAIKTPFYKASLQKSFFFFFGWSLTAVLCKLLHVGLQRDELLAWGKARLGRTIAFDLASPAPSLVWDSCEGLLVQDGDGLAVTISPGSAVPFAARGFIYRNVHTVKQAGLQVPSSRPSTPDDLAIAMAEQAQATAEAAASTAADTRQRLADQENKIDTFLKAFEAREQRDLRAHQERQRQQEEQHIRQQEQHRLLVESLHSELKELRASVASATRSASRSASPVPKPPLVLGPTAALPAPALPPAPAPGTTLSTAITVATTPSTRSSASVPLWSAPPVARAPSLSSATTDELTQLALARQAASGQQVWSSHDLLFDEIFEDAERSLLQDLPLLYLHKREEHFDAVRRAVFYAAQWILRWQTKAPADISLEFDRHLTAVDGALTPKSALQLAESLSLIGAEDVPRQHRVRAWWQLALLTLQCHKTHHVCVRRIETAMVSMKPSSEKEVAAWMKGTTKVHQRSSVPVPISSAGF